MFWLSQQWYSQLFLHQQRFIQYLASRNTLFNLNNYLDKSAMQGKDLSLEENNSTAFLLCDSACVGTL